jgi:hypothetical protein
LIPSAFKYLTLSFSCALSAVSHSNDDKYRAGRNI